MILRALVAEYLELGDIIGDSQRLKRRDELASARCSPGESCR